MSLGEIVVRVNAPVLCCAIPMGVNVNVVLCCPDGVQTLYMYGTEVRAG